MTDMWGDLVWAALADLKTRLMLVLPGILAMLTLAAVGLAGAWVSAPRRPPTGAGGGLRSPRGGVGHRGRSQPRGGAQAALTGAGAGRLLERARPVPAGGHRRARHPRHRAPHRVRVLVGPPRDGRRADPPRGLARGELPRRGRPHRRGQRPPARGAAPGPSHPLGRAPLRERHRHHHTGHRQGDGAGRVRDHLRRG